MEGENEGHNGDSEDFESWLSNYITTKGEAGNNISNDGNRGTSTENGSIYSEQQASNGKRIDGGSTENSDNVSHSLKSKYNEYNTVGMQWAYSSSTQIGDKKVLYNPYKKKFVLVEATKEDVGFIELKTGTYKQMREDERNYESNKQGKFSDDERTIDTAIHNFEFRQNDNTWNNVDAGNRETGIQNAQVSEGKSNSNGATDPQTTDGDLEKKSYSLGNSIRTKIKYSPKGIKLPANEYAKFHQSTSTDYYKSYKSHEGLQYQSCVTDDTHILYVYEDGGFGEYNVVARVDYKYDAVAKAITEDLNNGKHYKVTELINEMLEIHEVRRSGYSLYNAYTKKRSGSRGDGTLFEGQSDSYAGRINENGCGTSSNERGTGIDRSTGRGLNESKSYSLKEYWKTDLTKSQLKTVEGWLRQAGNPETTRITDTANWYKGRINGEDLFVIYSTVNSNNPTILYETKGKNATLELDILLERLEDIENGGSIIEPKKINSLLGGYRVQEKLNMANNNVGPRRRGSNIGYASVLQGKSSEYIGSSAFRKVIKNLFDIQEKSVAGNRKEEHSLKGTVVEGELASLVKKYGVIPKGEKPYRDVTVPKKTAKDEKVSQTVRTILGKMGTYIICQLL